MKTSPIALASVVVVLLSGTGEAQTSGTGPSERGRHWQVGVVATVVYAGLVAAAPYERNNRRTLPTTAGVAGGAVLGVATVGLVGMALDDSPDEVQGLVEALGSLSMLAGGVIGGVAAHALADSPGARATVTAVGLAPVYLLTFAWALD
jgi:hypothetical protein